MPPRTFHPTELSLLEAIHADPKSDMPRLVYADWLEERGYPLGEFMRLQVEHRGSVIFGEEKRHYTTEREQTLLKLHKWDWARPVPRHLRPLLFALGLPVLQFRMDFDVPHLGRIEQLTSAELDKTLEDVNPRVRFAMVCCDTPRLAELLKHRFFARVDILAVLVGPDRQQASGRRIIGSEVVTAVADCPYLRNFWNVQLECEDPGAMSASNELHIAITTLPSEVRVHTKVEVRLSTAMFDPMFRRRVRRENRTPQ